MVSFIGAILSTSSSLKKLLLFFYIVNSMLDLPISRGKSYKYLGNKYGRPGASNTLVWYNMKYLVLLLTLIFLQNYGGT